MVPQPGGADIKCNCPLACEQASLFGKRVKKSQGVGRERVRACS